MARSLIPENLYPIISEMTNNGAVGREIQAWLEKEHGIVLSLPTVLRRTKLIRKERSEVTKAIYAREAEKTVVSDLEIINEMIETLVSDYRSSRSKNDLRQAGQVSRDLRPWIELRAKCNGLNEEINLNINNDISEDKLEDLRDDLIAKLGLVDDSESK